MLYGQGNIDPQVNDNEAMDNTWLDYLVMSAPHNVMEVLSRNGYSGYLAPQSEQELLDAAYDFIEREKEKGVIELLKAHPLYDAIADTVRQEKKILFNFLNADGSESSVVSSFMSIDYRKVIEMLLIIIGVFYVANKVYAIFTKS